MASASFSPQTQARRRYGFEIGLVLLLSVSVLAGKQIYDFSRYSQSTLWTERVRFEVQSLELRLREAQAAAQDYVNRSSPDHVKRYNVSVQAYGESYQRLKTLLSSFQSNPVSMNTLISANNKIFDLMNRTLKDRMNGSLTEGVRASFLSQMEHLEGQSSLEFRNFLNQVNLNSGAKLEDLKKEAHYIFLTIVLGAILGGLLLLWARSVAQKESENFRTLSQILAAGQEDLVKAHKRVQALSAAKSEFLANMSHEVRTPLNAITGLSHILHRTATGSEQKELIQGIQKSAQSLLEVINPILDYSKIEHEGLQLQVDPSVDLESLAKESQEIMAGQAKLKSLELKIETPEPLLPVETDSVRLRQVFLNLIGNAIKFTEKGSVKLRISRLQGPSDSYNLLFEVIDTGIGIPDQAKQKLFNSFTQSDNSISRQYGGTGLGLSISKAIVEKMGGQIGFESQVGVGTNFWFKIPFVPARVAPPPSKKKSETFIGPHFKHVRALIIEDNPMNQFVLRNFLEELGCSVEVTSSAFDGLDRLARETFSIIFIDVQMPGMDGFTATERIRRMDFDLRRKSFIVATTAHAMNGYRERCLEAGMDEYLAKPVVMESLYEILQKNFSSSGSTAAATKTGNDTASETNIQSVNLEKWKKMNSQASSQKYLKEMLSIYNSSTPEKYLELEKGLETSNLESVRDSAHFLKSSANALGFDLLAELLAKVEELADSPQNWNQIHQLWGQVQAERLKLEPYLRSKGKVG